MINRITEAQAHWLCETTAQMENLWQEINDLKSGNVDKVIDFKERQLDFMLKNLQTKIGTMIVFDDKEK